jgi:hypothetical protein
LSRELGVHLVVFVRFVVVRPVGSSSALPLPRVPPVQEPVSSSSLRVEPRVPESEPPRPLRGLQFERQRPLPVTCKGVRLDCDYHLDIVLGDLLLVEIKAAPHLLPVHQGTVRK